MRILQKSQPKLVTKDVSRIENDKGSSRPGTTDYYNSIGGFPIKNSSSQIEDAAANSTIDDILTSLEPVDGLFDTKFQSSIKESQDTSGGPPEPRPKSQQQQAFRIRIEHKRPSEQQERLLQHYYKQYGTHKSLINTQKAKSTASKTSVAINKKNYSSLVSNVSNDKYFRPSSSIRDSLFKKQQQSVLPKDQTKEYCEKGSQKEADEVNLSSLSVLKDRKLKKMSQFSPAKTKNDYKSYNTHDQDGSNTQSQSTAN